MNLAIAETDFATILPLWKLLWPGRVSVIRPVSTIVYLGGKDQSIATKYGDQARFFGITDLDKDTLVGVFSGHPTTEHFYRARGLYVDPNYQGLGLGTLMVNRVVNAAADTGSDLCWCIPRVANIGFFERSGFVQTSEATSLDMEFGPNAYMARAILPL